MQVAINLAEKNVGNTGKNPSVACLIVKNNIVLGLGVTGSSGRPHAEYNAILNSRGSLKGSTAYVTLEPCSHESTTPSCARVLAESGVKRVICPIIDPNPIVAGKGFKILKDFGVHVQMSDYYSLRAGKIIEGFAKRMLTGLPFVTLKLAVSLDGKIATRSGESKWISGIASRKQTQLIRFRNDAIMIGSGTFKEDDPELSIRENFGSEKQPIRIILSSQPGFEANGNIFETLKSQETIIFTCKNNKKAWTAWEKSGAKIFEVANDEGNLDLEKILYQLGSYGVSNLLIEGGAKLSKSLIQRKLVDRIIIFYSGKVIGSSGISAISSFEDEYTSLDEFPHFCIEETKKYGNDLMISWTKGVSV